MCGGKVAIPPIVKEKRRNSEKRKEKSRDAARCRRSKESEIFTDLSSQLPLSQGVASTLDKASVMRLAVGFLKIRKMMMEVVSNVSRGLTVNIADSVYATVLNGFLLVLSEEGDIIYLSENVEEFLGIPQVEMIGHSVYDFSHPCDHEEIKAFLASNSASKHSEVSQKEMISFFIRMKSTIKSKGRTVNLKSATYQVIHYTGHKFVTAEGANKCPAFYLMFIGKTIPHPAQIDVPLDKDIFISRHSPDMKFTYVDEKVTEFLGYKTTELLGQSVYFYHHATDASDLMAAFRTLFSKGQCETGYYRFLSKHGGYIWVVTQATLIYDNGTKPECVVCLNYVLSKTEHDDEIVSVEQEKIAENKVTPILKEAEGPPANPPVILSNTGAIFTPKETVMSKDFLNFPDADILLFQEPLKDSKLSLSFDLFQDEPCTLGSSICDDPFISYRDDSLSSPSYCGTSESSLHLNSSNSTSPNPFSTTPSTPDSGSLSDIPSLDPIDDFSNLDLKFTMPPSVSDKDSDCYEEDLDFRAPFISMNMDDDFPLISPSSSVMWGPQEPPLKKPALEKLPDPEPQRILPLKHKSVKDGSSSLAALLQSDLKKNPQTKEKGAASRKDSSLHKRWQNSSVDNNKNNMRQKNFGSSRSYTNGSSGGGGGHVILLDTIPVKKQPGKSGASQKRNGHVASNDRRTNSSSYRSSITTMNLPDRVIKVQVSVSELSTAPIEHKQPFPSPPDPPPKRACPSRPGPTGSPKRIKLDNGLLGSGIASDSVLLNLLISGEDASRGYLCSGNSRYSQNKYEPASSLLSLPSSDCSSSPDSSSSCSELLTSESELLDSFLKISQYDAEVNAPIQSSHLLQGDDLLSALDHQPLLRNVPALV